MYYLIFKSDKFLGFTDSESCKNHLLDCGYLIKKINSKEELIKELIPLGNIKVSCKHEDFNCSSCLFSLTCSELDNELNKLIVV